MRESGNMKFGKADVMWPMKPGEAVWTDWETTFSLRNSV
jgi:hypothetical protein